MRRIALLAVIATVTGCASMLDEDGALAVVPYRISSVGQIVVDARLNDDGPFSFAIDTGASITVVFDETRQAAGIEALTSSRVSIQGLVASGQFPLVSVKRLWVGEEGWADARMASIPGDSVALGSIDGILGVDFLSRYSVGLSTANKALRLYPPELTSERAYLGWTSIPLHSLQIPDSKATAYTIDLVIGPETIPALFDLGATTNVMNWRAARALEVRPLQPKQRNSVAGALQSAPIKAEININLVKTQNIHWRNRTFLIADFPVFEVLDTGGQPMAIVGTDLFGGRDLIIDFARNRVLVKMSQ
ncbi:MAG TPA: aspartyl protease family protein [Woeseiaceae bacterium]|nr:aspartyl protease family protein [Woeseiaceae bacterium]